MKSACVTEQQNASVRVALALRPLAKGLVGAILGLDGGGECLWIESSVAPRDRSEVDDVADSPVAERHEIAASNPLDERTLEHEIVVAEREQIGAVHALWGRGEARA